MCRSRRRNIWRPKNEIHNRIWMCSDWFIVCTGIPRAIVHRCPADLVSFGFYFWYWLFIIINNNIFLTLSIDQTIQLQVFYMSTLKCNYRDETYACTGVMTTTTVTTRITQSLDEFEPASLGFCDDKLLSSIVATTTIQFRHVRVVNVQQQRCSHKMIHLVVSFHFCLSLDILMKTDELLDVYYYLLILLTFIVICWSIRFTVLLLLKLVLLFLFYFSFIQILFAVHDFYTTKMTGNYPLHSVVLEWPRNGWHIVLVIHAIRRRKRLVCHHKMYVFFVFLLFLCCPLFSCDLSKTFVCIFSLANTFSIVAGPCVCAQCDGSSNLCVGRFSGFYAVPDDCSKFVFCSKGMPVGCFIYTKSFLF